MHNATKCRSSPIEQTCEYLKYVTHSLGKLVTFSTCRKRRDRYNRPKAERHYEEGAGASSSGSAAALGTYDSIDIEGDDSDSLGTAGSAAGSTGEILRR